MPSLLETVTGFRGCMDQRPSRDQFTGINTDSVQANGLMAWWPVWEPHANAQKAPQAMDYGPYGMHFTPSINTLHVPDPQMGVCWSGKPNPSAMTGAFSGQAQNRTYAWGSGASGTLVDPVDFGNIPSTGAWPNTGVSYMSSAWAQTSASGLTLTTNDNPPDMYIYSFDRNDGTNYPGHTLGAICRTPNGAAAVAALSATMYDNSQLLAPFGVMSLQAINDGLWHLICGIYVPANLLNGANQTGGQQWILVDGQLGFVGGVDGPGPGQLPFGYSQYQALLGSPQDATHAATTPVYQCLGADDDGVGSPWLGLIGDHRFYSYPIPPSNASGTVDVLQMWTQLAAHMYAPETRWELYQAPTRRVAFSTAVSVYFPNNPFPGLSGTLMTL